MAIVIGNKLVVYCKNRESKSDGRNYPRGFFEMGGQLYRIEVNKDPKTQKEGVGAILTITKCQKPNNDFGGNQGGGYRGQGSGGGYRGRGSW